MDGNSNDYDDVSGSVTRIPYRVTMTSVRQGRQLSHTGDSGGVTLETYADGFLVSGVK